MRAIQVGEFLGNRRFEIIGRIGAGGMGAVFVAYDNELQTRVALKMLKEREAGAILLFKKEFRAIQDLQHPNLIRLGELFEQDRMWFFSMELLNGCDFLAYVRPTADRKDRPSTGATDASGRTEYSPPPSPPATEAATAADQPLAQGHGSRPATAPATAPMTLQEPVDDQLTDEDEHFQTADLPTDDPPRPATDAQCAAAALDPAESGLPHPHPPPAALGAATFDEARLRLALGQLGRALCVLHEARKVHRDIKPSNPTPESEHRANDPLRREALAGPRRGGGQQRAAATSSDQQRPAAASSGQQRPAAASSDQQRPAADRYASQAPHPGAPGVIRLSTHWRVRREAPPRARWGSCR